MIWLFVLAFLGANVIRFGLTEACNGYALKLNKVEACLPNSLFKPENFEASFDKDCNVLLSGCLDLIKGYKTANLKYSLKKAPMPPLEGDVNLCEVFSEIPKGPLMDLFTSVGIPKSCPAQPKKTCLKKGQKFSINKYKNQIGMAVGTSEVKLEIDHDSGKSCIEMSVTISRERRSG